MATIGFDLPRNRFFGLCLALVSSGLIACGSDSNDLQPAPPGGHGHIEIGSSSPGGGSILMELPSTTVHVTEGGTVGSLTLWSSSDPALATLEEDHPDDGLYALPEGAPVSLEVVALDGGVRFSYGDAILEEPGDSVELGLAPFHDHGLWEVVVPEGVHEGEFDLSFRLTTTTPPYAASEPATFTLVLTEGEHGDDHNE